MKKTIVLILMFFILTTSVFAGQVEKTGSFTSIGPTVGASTVLETIYTGINFSTGSLAKEVGSNFYFGTAGHVDAAVGADFSEQTPLVLGAFGGAAFRVDMTDLLSLGFTLGPAVTWKSKVSSPENPESVIVFGLGAGADVSLQVFFSPSRSFGMFLEAYAYGCFNLSQAIDAPKSTFFGGAAIGAVFNYNKRISAEASFDKLLDMVL